MQVQRAEWVSHDSFPLYAVDIQPGSLRFATGGADGTARVWSTAALLDPSLELQESLRSPLYTTTSHSAGVRAVRWSTGGRFLATGGDEGTVVVHELKPGPGMRTFGSTRAGGGGAGAGLDAEPWTPVFVIKGHSLEVQDLAWCPCNDLDIETWLSDLTVCPVPARLAGHAGGQRRRAAGKIGAAVERNAQPPMIASCSNDNLVCVWALLDNRLSPGRMQHQHGGVGGAGAGAGSSLDMPAKHVPVTGPCTISSPLLTIKTHTSWVQGVSWDPLGHYLTSISDDRSMSVWRTSIPAGAQAAAVLQKEVFEAQPVQREEDEDEEAEEQDVESLDASYARRMRQLLKQGAEGWHEVDFINVPFQECASQGPIRRVDWSCDGAVVAGTHAKVFETLTLSLMSRPERVPVMHLAGHIRPVVAVRSSSVLCMSVREAERVDGRGPTGASGSAPSSVVHATHNGGPGTPPRAVAAGAGTVNATTFPLLFAGSNDRSVSVWSPTRCTPLFVLTGGLTSGGPVADFACAPVPQAATLAALRQRRIDAAVQEVQALASAAPNDAVLSRLCSALEAVASLNLAQLYAQSAPRCVTATAGLVTLAVTLDGSAVSVILPSPSSGDAGSASSSSPSSLGVCAADGHSALMHMSSIYGLDSTAVLAGEGLPVVRGSGKGKAGPGQSRRQSRHRGDAKTEEDSDQDDHDAAAGEAVEEGEPDLADVDEAEPAPALAPIEVLTWLQRRQLLYGPLSTSVPARPVFVPDVPLAVLRVTQPQAARAIQALHAAHVLAAAPPKQNIRGIEGPAGESQNSLAGGSLTAEGLVGAGSAGMGGQAGTAGGAGGPSDIERRQVVTVLKDGRRRIQPVLVTMEDDFAAFPLATEERAVEGEVVDRGLPLHVPEGVNIASTQRPEEVLGLVAGSEGEAMGFGSALAGLLGTVSGRVVQDDPDVSFDAAAADVSFDAAAAGAGAGPSGSTLPAPVRPTVGGTSSALDVLQARLQASAGRGSSSTASLHSTLPLLRPHPFAAFSTGGGEGGSAIRAVTWGRRRLTQAQREQRVQLYASEAQAVAHRLERLRTEAGDDEGEDEVDAQGDVGMGMGGYGNLAGQQQQPFYAQAHHAGLAIQHKQAVAPASSLLPHPLVLPRITTMAAAASTPPGPAPLRGSASAQLMSVLDPALAMLQADSSTMDMDWGIGAAPAGSSSSSSGAQGKGGDIRYFTAYAPTAGSGTGNAPLQLDAVTTSSTAWSRTLPSRPTVLLHVPAHGGFPLSLLLIGCADGALHVCEAETGRPALARGMAVMATQGAQPVRDLAYIAKAPEPGARQDEESCMRVACLGCDGSLTVWSVALSPSHSSSGAIVQLRVATKTTVAPVLSLVSGLDAPGSGPAPGTDVAAPTLGGLQLDPHGNVSILAVLPNKPRAQFVWDSAAGSWTR